MLFPLLQTLWETFKPTPKPSSEPTPDAQALSRVRDVMDKLSERFTQRVEVSEVYGSLDSALNGEIDTTSSEFIGHYEEQHLDLSPYPQIIGQYITSIAPEWEWPDAFAPKHLWFSDSLDRTGAFERIPYWESCRDGDIAFWDGRVGNGYGAMGVVVRQEGDYLRVFLESPTSKGTVFLNKSGLLGYFRPKTTKIQGK